MPQTLNKYYDVFFVAGQLFLFALALCFPFGASANSEINDVRVSSMCDTASEMAARTHQVPLDVMRAISRTETGRRIQQDLRPWPWTVNMEGSGRWFKTEDEARAFVFAHFKRGARSFDVGCFQINYKWHGAAFRSIDEMFDPESNADYAARFLSQLFEEMDDWSLAVGAFHSRTPENAQVYAARFEKIRDRLRASEPIARDRGTDPTKTLRGPLFGKGQSALGSLMPMPARDVDRSSALIALK